MKTHYFLFILSTSFFLPQIMADTTFGTSDASAWDANTGWVSFRHDRPSSPDGVVFGEAFLSGYAYSTNLGWISMGNGAPSNGYSYSNTGTDHGVNHDGLGNLSGFAWSANTGWINFGWATTADLSRPRVDLLTGDFAGYVWGANTGWLNLGSRHLITESMMNSDKDSDRIADFWEMQNFGNLTAVSSDSDKDKDGVSDLSEYLAATDPNDSNSYLKIVSQSYDAGITEVTIEFTSSPTRLYRIEYSTDLGITDSWNNSPLSTFRPDAGSTTTRTITFGMITSPQYFFRAIAVTPLNL